MVTRRTVLKQGGCIALASTVPLLGPARAAATTFDYYISTNGKDSNPGTLASPWSITALNTQRSTYAGKRVGIIAGTYNTFALNQAGAWSKPGLSVNGGSASSPTYVASCDSTGNYSPRAATLTALNPSGGAFPTVECGVIGQAYGTVTNSGNVILDGLIVTGSYEYGVVFYPGGGSSSQEGGPTGVVIQNCEISNVSGYENDNLGGILLSSLTGAVVRNCKIHNCVPTSGNIGNQDCAGIFSFHCHSNVYEYNTIYNTTCGIYDKNELNGNHTYRYNYIEQDSAVGPYALFALMDCAGGNAGDVMTVHHNVFIAPQTWSGTNPFHDPSLQGLIFYNNTCYFGNGGFNPGGLWYPASGPAISPAAMVTLYNNIFNCKGNPNYQGFLNLIKGSVALSDYNAYSSSAAYFGLASPSNPWTPTLYTFAAWQNNGFDRHSQVGTPGFASPTSLNPTGYQLLAGSVGKGAGSTTGTASGTACDMGAWGYDPALGGPPAHIGCNFSPLPSAPALTVS
jgi:Right handed beta helix region